MIHVKNFSSKNNINIFNIIKIFKPDEDIIFTDDFTKKGLFIECIYKDTSSIVKLFKDGSLLDEKTKDNTNFNYSKIKLTINNLYEVLSNYYNYKSDYGTLTGIRPVKLVRKYLGKGLEPEEIKNELETKYLLKTDKINKLIDIASRERGLIDSSKTSLYINIPFCPSKCSYCNFVSFISKDKDIDTYMEYLLKDLEENLNLINKYSLEVESIYIGGGTPSILSVSHMERLLKFCSDNIKCFKEFTFEAGRIDTLNKEKIKLLKKYNVTRISINPQSLNQKTLDRLNRKQDLNEFNKYFEICKEENILINSDLIIGLPGENVEDMKYTLDELIKLKPDNITIHTLAIKNQSNIKFNENIIPDRDLEKAYNYSYNRLLEEGYKPYYLYGQKNILGNLDNIGYSLKNKESLYNINIIEETQNIISAGLGSVSKIIRNNKVHRIPYNKSLKDYCHKYNYVNLNKEKYLK